MTSAPLTLLVVAAEASGDALGGELVAALRRRLGDDVRFVGVGGARLSEQGMTSLFDPTELAVLGLVEGLFAYRRVLARVEQVVQFAQTRHVDAAILIDSWGFNLRVARGLRRRLPGVRIIKYVGPQVWASRPGRARTLARAVDHLLTLYAIDAPFYAGLGLPLTLVGAPALKPALDADHDGSPPLRARLGLGPGDDLLAVLPGSRPAEVARLARPLRDAIERLRRERPALHVVIPVAEPVEAAVRAWAAGLGPDVEVIAGERNKREAFRQATVALACSGTVATELAVAQTPVVVAYRLGGLSYMLFRLIATTRYACLLNIAAGAEIVPERLQTRCRGDLLARAVSALLVDEASRRRQVEAQNRALETLGSGATEDAAELAAEAVLTELGRTRAVRTVARAERTLDE